MDPRADDLLNQPLIGQLGFQGLDGYPHVLPVWYRYQDGEILISTPPGAYKCRSLRDNPRASLAVSTDWPYRLVTVTGDVAVEVLEEPRRIEFVTEVAARYLGTELGGRYIEGWMGDGGPGDGELLRLRPARIRFYDVSGE